MDLSPLQHSCAYPFSPLQFACLFCLYVTQLIPCLALPLSSKLFSCCGQEHEQFVNPTPPPLPELLLL